MIANAAPLVDLSEFSNTVFRKSLGRLVLCKGVYDLTHAGHVASLAAASVEGDTLAVAIASDESTRLRKGPGRPILTLPERLTIVSNLRMVDIVTIYNDETPLSLLVQVKPAVYCATHLSWLKEEERRTLESLDIELRVLPRPKWSSTSAIVQSIEQAIGAGEKLYEDQY
jgi:rfaE bifunctional protein nucleotidyltransferase chain/domain